MKTALPCSLARLHSGSTKYFTSSAKGMNFPVAPRLETGGKAGGGGAGDGVGTAISWSFLLGAPLHQPKDADQASIQSADRRTGCVQPHLHTRQTTPKDPERGVAHPAEWD